MLRFSAAGALATLVFSLGALSSAGAQSAPASTMELHVDATHAVQGILYVHERIAVSQRTLTLVYPKWLPGEHAPNGPIANVTDLAVHAGSTALAWQRDPVDLYAFHVDVPAGVASVDVDFTFLGNAIPGESSDRLATPTLMALEWNKVVLAPQVDDSRSLTITPSIQLPSADWKFATALETASAKGSDVAFAPVTLETLLDSPLDAGINERTIDLGSWSGVPVTLAAFADTPDELLASEKTVAKFRSVVVQMHALYHNRHFRHYTFLLAMSDEMGAEGLEHHQSSDDGTAGDFFTNESTLLTNGTLLPHEFNHSWNGKYRRPNDLATPNTRVPMIGDLLWVYEGMTQMYGNLVAERAGLRTEQQWLDGLASTYAYYDVEHGRLDTPLVDTATASSIRRGYSAWSSERRSQDYYSEGELMWLQADVIIRRLSGGKKSLDTVVRAFFGAGKDSAPQVITYTREDLIAALNAVQPYDWKTFLAQRIDVVTPHPPDLFAMSGYKLVYTDTPTAFSKLTSKTVNMWWSLGMNARRDGTIGDVRRDSPADRAGMGPGLKIVAVNDRTFTGQDQIDRALKAARNSGPPIRLLVTGGDVYRSVTFDYHDGPRFPNLQRIDGTLDELGAIAKPLPGTL